MFQYAAGYAVARRLNTKLYLDLDWYKGSNAATQCKITSVFEINQSDHIDHPSIRRLRFFARPTVLPLYNLYRLATSSGFSIIKEPTFSYWSDICHVPNNSYLSGYWQSERYFHSIREDIRLLFSFRPLIGINARLIHQIKASNSIAIHVRRGDYLNSANKSLHGVDLTTYYRQAIKLITLKISNPHFFLFSDDPNGALQFFSDRTDVSLVCNNIGEDSYIDMQLMSQCKHHIIANSTFSWWGAWLANKSRGWTIAPSKWFVDHSIDTSDLHCSDWTLL